MIWVAIAIVGIGIVGVLVMGISMIITLIKDHRKQWKHLGNIDDYEWGERQ